MPVRSAAIGPVHGAPPGSSGPHGLLGKLPLDQILTIDDLVADEDVFFALTGVTTGELVRGVRYADHVAFTVPDLDQAVQFFVEALGAQELYRSTRGPDAQFMPKNFAVPADARLTLAMLRMPPNLNVELFEWSSSDRRTEHPRHSDAGGHHLCFTVADVDQAVAVLRGIPGVRLLGDRKEVAEQTQARDTADRRVAAELAQVALKNGPEERRDQRAGLAER